MVLCGGWGCKGLGVDLCGFMWWVGVQGFRGGLCGLGGKVVCVLPASLP